MKISIIIPVYNVNKKRFVKTLDSLVEQEYKDFEVCISDGGAESFVEDIIKEYNDKLDIKYYKSNKKLGISDNTNAALKLASGSYISFLDHDDLLMEDTLLEVSKKIDEEYDVIYTDEEIVDEDDKVLNKFFKPDYSIDLLQCQNYICHFLTINKKIVDLVGPFNKKFDGAQDYDYILRVIEKTDKICHIPKILYKWLSTSDSTSTNASSKPYAQTAGLMALDEHLKRVYGKNAKALESDYLFVYKPTFNNLNNEKVDIIIPMRDKWSLSKECVESILEKTKYDNYQITIINNNSEQQLTFDWFKEIEKKSKKIRILDANFEFNWSKLQNFGVKNSDADIFVFLNNDTVIIDENWLNILCENAKRDDVGVVGPLLLYEDGTIQHAGVVVGLGGYADHVYKGANLIHANINYVSPMVQRNTLALTGACMAISRKTLDKIGLFNEEFIICGSDVEICIRAYENGLNNIYTPFTKLVHLESKSRDSYVPSIDYSMSQLHYGTYWLKGDPFYNPNLDYNYIIPTEVSEKSKKVKRSKPKKSLREKLKKNKFIYNSYHNLKGKLRNRPFAVKLYRKIKHIDTFDVETTRNGMVIDYTIPEIKYINPIPCKLNNKMRINILIPSLNADKVFGGIATAMKFFNQFNDDNYDKRIIVFDTPTPTDDIKKYKEYILLDNKKEDKSRYQVVNISDKSNCNLLVSENDIFIASAWWTAYSIRKIIKWQKDYYKLKKYNKLLYFIQDYEPFFYAWSSRLCSAESTYRMDIPVIAIFNSKELKDYFDIHNYKFDKSYFFDPILNDGLKKHLLEDKEKERKKQIIVYGRPNTQRNAFEIVEEALMIAFKDRKDVNEWKFISMGETHYNAKITDSASLISVGKLSLDQYANFMEESYLGISLMVSPHPSYPPLEMSSFGVKTITNKYDNKDLSYFNDNIISVDYCDAELIAKEIVKYVDQYDELSKKSKKVINDSYVNSSNKFDDIIDDIKKTLKN